MKIFIALFAATLSSLLMACQKDLSTTSAPVEFRPLISSEKLIELKNMDSTLLGKRALVGELGACEMKKVEGRGCWAGQSYALYLKNENVFFPTMTKSVPTNGMCDDFNSSNMRMAIEEGYCFQNEVSLTSFSVDAIGRKAQVNELGHCAVREVTSGCRDGQAYGLFLANKNVFYTSMEPYLTADNGKCADGLGSDAKAALTAGLCF